MNSKYTIKQNQEGCKGYALMDPDGKMIGCYDTRKQAELARSGAGEDTSDLATNESNAVVSTEKSEHIQEGDYVMGMTVEGIAHGRVEHIMWEGGVLGEPGTEYAIESMPPENPAMSVRVYKQEDEGMWKPTAYSIGMKYQDAERLDTLDNHTMPEEMEDQMVEMSKEITQINHNMFYSFGKDVTSAERLTSIFKASSVRSGQMVSWNSSGGRARGKVKRVIRSGSYDVPDTDITINATEEDPAVVITLYRDGEPTDTTVAHRMSTLTVTSS